MQKSNLAIKSISNNLFYYNNLYIRKLRGLSSYPSVKIKRAKFTQVDLALCSIMPFTSLYSNSKKHVNPPSHKIKIPYPEAMKIEIKTVNVVQYIKPLRKETHYLLLFRGTRGFNADQRKPIPFRCKEYKIQTNQISHSIDGKGRAIIIGSVL